MAMRLNSNRSKIYQPPYTRLTTRSFVWRVASPFFGDALSPTNQLPAEVLLRIMMEVRPTQPCPPASWIQFTQVCHYWRTLSLGDPLLWTELYIPSMSAPWVCEFILRSRKAPLLLYISSHYVPGSKDSARALSVITGIMNRITNFSYYESQTTQASTWTRHLEQLHLSTSPLESLTMWGCKRMYQTWKPTSTLKYLDLNRGHFDDAFILQSLVTLKLQDLNADTLPPLSDFYRTLSSLANLRYLVLQNVLKQIATKTKGRLPFSIPNISIPSLQELQLVHESEKECARFLSHLVSPNLTGLYIYFDNYTTPSSVLNKELVSVWTNTRLLNPPNEPPSRFVLLADTSDTRFELVSPNAPRYTKTGIRWASGIQPFGTLLTTLPPENLRNIEIFWRVSSDQGFSDLISSLSKLPSLKELRFRYDLKPWVLSKFLKHGIPACDCTQVGIAPTLSSSNQTIRAGSTRAASSTLPSGCSTCRAFAASFFPELSVLSFCQAADIREVNQQLLREFLVHRRACGRLMDTLSIDYEKRRGSPTDWALVRQLKEIGEEFWPS